MVEKKLYEIRMKNKATGVISYGETEAYSEKQAMSLATILNNRFYYILEVKPKLSYAQRIKVKKHVRDTRESRAYYFIYGTLRKGDYNYDNYSLGKVTTRLKGLAKLHDFELRLNEYGNFPEIVPKRGVFTVGELVHFKQSPKAQAVELSIEQMELSVGYSKALVTVRHHGRAYQAFAFIKESSQGIPIGADWLKWVHVRKNRGN